MTSTTTPAPYAIGTDEALWEAGGFGFAMKMLARGAETDDTITVMDYTCPPGFAAPCRLIDTYNPAGPEEMFVDINDHASSCDEGPDPAVMLEVHERYCKVLGPPIGL